ncbi:[Pyruvate dehydrogenase (acetyl-transferring)] kinase, mitochondrial [Smittium culicis]|uniref:Protein-serine/threonine kinase n=1 Tax=Smittium culicis TaxID=133412 RepID=A0A1R1Y0T6_9FUNG|nr:[Pyruvate dehydrogenase (acetyl-transferring)] kinase, mitochondrial [Smittium culicis]
MLSDIPKALAEKIIRYAKMPQTGVSLRQMIRFGQNPNQGTLLRASEFVYDELPIRLAHRVVELDTMPEISRMNSVLKELIHFPKVPEKIRDLVLSNTINEVGDTSNHNNINDFDYKNYYHSTRDVKYPLEVSEYNSSLVKLISNIKKRHDAVVITIAQGVKDYKRDSNLDVINNQMQTFLDRFYLSRIGIRMLIGQTVELNNRNRHKDYVGIICTKTRVHNVIQEAIDNAKYICQEYYFLSNPPKIELYCPTSLEFPYVPSHLHHMLFELIKNCLRATVELYGEDADSYPPIKVIVASGSEDIAIKISDEGGGISRSALEKVWTYMYTTADNTPDLEDSFDQTDFKAPLAGFGYGLPLSRLYARYFGGDLKIISMENYGTDAYLHLSRLSDSEEPLC